MQNNILNIEQKTKEKVDFKSLEKSKNKKAIILENKQIVKK
jgi:hypothetical protein